MSPKNCREHARMCERRAANKKSTQPIREQWLELAYHWQLCADPQEGLFASAENATRVTVH